MLSPIPTTECFICLEFVFPVFPIEFNDFSRCQPYLELGRSKCRADASLLSFFGLLQRRNRQGTDVVMMMMLLLLLLVRMMVMVRQAWQTG